MPEWAIQVFKIVGIALASEGLSRLIIFLVERRDKKRKMLNDILQALQKQERDNCRTQLLLLMSDYPEEVQELMKLAKHYFVDLNGDWYATTIFQNHLEKMGLRAPRWFNANHHAKNDEDNE